MDKELLRGRGSQSHTVNRFSLEHLDLGDPDASDEPFLSESPVTQYFQDSGKTLVNKVNSPDLGFMYSANPYQGCEHGCIYCYARNSHEYWGFNAGLDFESKIVIKKNAPALLETYLLKSQHVVSPISFSGNTDCYQPVERKLELTRRCLEVLLNYRHPVTIITKNALIERDIDLLGDLAKHGLVNVYISVTTLDETLRQRMEPRTSTSQNRLRAVERLSSKGVPVGVMVAPVIPWLNHHEIPEILKRASESGACSAGYAVVRLNGAIGGLFSDWLVRHYPERSAKVVRAIERMHDGQMNDSEFFRRMKGDGPEAEMIEKLYRVSKRQYFSDRSMPSLQLGLFRKGGNYTLF